MNILTNGSRFLSATPVEPEFCPAERERTGERFTFEPPDELVEARGLALWWAWFRPGDQLEAELLGDASGAFHVRFLDCSFQPLPSLCEEQDQGHHTLSRTPHGGIVYCEVRNLDYRDRPTRLVLRCERVATSYLPSLLLRMVGDLWQRWKRVIPHGA